MGPCDLTADEAEIHGSSARLEGGSERNIGYWTDASDSVSWTARITQPGVYEVEVVQACPDDSAGTSYTLSIGPHTLASNVVATSGWQSYKAVLVGKVKINQPGSLIIKVVPGKLRGYAVMNLRAVVLEPAPL